MMEKSKRNFGPLLIILAGCFWGSMGIFVRKLSVYGFSPIQIVSIWDGIDRLFREKDELPSTVTIMIMYLFFYQASQRIKQCLRLNGLGQVSV